MITREEAWKLLTEFNKDPFHLRHALTVEGAMRHFARTLGYAEEEDFWGLVGLLHDLDEPYREVFMLRTLGQLSFRNIGELFGKSQNWACVVYSRARARIRERMEETL